MPPLMWEVAEPVDHHVEEGDRYARALARLRAPDERSEGGDGGVGPRADIAHGHANPGRLPVEPVTEMSPVSPCMTRSYAFRCAYGPSGP